MFGFGKTKNEISVEFVDQGTNETFARSVMPIDQLPETFEINTTLDIGEDKWSVVSAEPARKAEFAKTGKLKVYLAKIQYMNPADLLYSLPTISNELAGLKDTPTLENVLILREDDWRQIEFLSDILSADAIKEIAAIRSIYENERKGAGFKSLHVRKSIPEPLKGRSLTLRNLKEAFGVSHSYEGIAYNTAHAVIDGGFAFESTIGVQIWGQVNEDGILKCLCFSPLHNEVDKDSFTKTVGEFSAENKLIFVDWVRTFTANSTDTDFNGYLN